MRAAMATPPPDRGLPRLFPGLTASGDLSYTQIEIIEQWERGNPPWEVTMIRRMSSLACGALVCLVAASPALAQNVGSTPRIYRLDEKSTFQEGCFDPCLCPIMMEVGTEGRFRLSFAGDVDSFRTFAVDKVRWIVPPLGRQYTGSGSYRLSTGPESQQQLALDLQEDGGTVERFDSGLVPAGPGFPDIAALISIRGMWCYDKVFDLRAAPSRPSPLVAARDFDLDWSAVEDASIYDVVYGDLSTLGDSGGDYTEVTLGCLANRMPSTTLAHMLTPEPGRGYWFVVRAADSEIWNTYDSNGAGQRGARTPAIDAAPFGCP